MCGRWSVCYPLCSKPTKTDDALRLSAACSAMHGRVLHLSRQFRILCCNIYDYDSKHEALPFLRHSSSVDQQQQQQREPQQQLEREKKKAEEFLVSSLPSYMTQHFVRNIIPKRANPNVQCVCVIRECVGTVNEEAFNGRLVMKYYGCLANVINKCGRFRVDARGRWWCPNFSERAIEYFRPASNGNPSNSRGGGMRKCSYFI